MQINFWMSEADELWLMSEILEQGCCLLPEYWPTLPIPTIHEPLAPLPADAPQPMLLWYWIVLVLASDANSVRKIATDRRIIESGGRYTARDLPGVRLMRSHTQQNQLLLGSIYIKGRAKRAVESYRHSVD